MSNTAVIYLFPSLTHATKTKIDLEEYLNLESEYAEKESSSLIMKRNEFMGLF